jgi:hypothetical protein
VDLSLHEYMHCEEGSEVKEGMWKRCEEESGSGDATCCVSSRGMLATCCVSSRGMSVFVTDKQKATAPRRLPFAPNGPTPLRLFPKKSICDRAVYDFSGVRSHQHIYPESSLTLSYYQRVYCLTKKSIRRLITSCSKALSVDSIVVDKH